MKRLIICFYLVCIVTSLFSETINKYEMLLTHIFETGEGKNHFIINMFAPSTKGPRTLVFNKAGNIFITDPYNGRLLEFDSKWQYVSEYLDCYAITAQQLIVDKEGNFLSYNADSFAIDDCLLQKKGLILLLKTEYKNSFKPGNYIYENYNIYIQLENNNYIYVENPGTNVENNLYKIRDPLETKNKLIAAKKRYLEGASDELYMDEKNRLFKGNKFITRDYQEFINYWTEKHEQDNKLKQVYHKIELPEGLKFTEIKNLRYLGEDNDGNIYWGYWRHHILIFDKDGWCIEGIDYDRDKTKCLPTIHPNGDVYFLDYDAEGVYLYKITRCW